MDFETRRKEDGTEIIIESEKEVAVVIQDGEEERIFLPPFQSEQDTYYVEPSQGVVQTEHGYRIYYPGKPTSIELFSK